MNIFHNHHIQRTHRILLVYQAYHQFCKWQDRVNDCHGLSYADQTKPSEAQNYNLCVFCRVFFLTQLLLILIIVLQNVAKNSYNW